jgi:FAD/FMN-containing dehydrogenase
MASVSPRLFADGNHDQERPAMNAIAGRGRQPMNAIVGELRGRREIAARVIIPGDAEYETARSVYWPLIDRRPAAIVKAIDAGDVAAVVSIARETGLELAVRSGGHSNAGHGVAEGGIVLDLSLMKAVRISRERGLAWAQTGLTAGEVTAAAAEHGLAIGFGDTASVGIGGLTLGGGIGHFVRKHGLTIDDLVAAEVVTADGELLSVDTERHPDLFWALRGGGGNFGVATRFTYRLHPDGVVTAGVLILPATAQTIARFITAADSAPDEVSTIATVMLAPPLPTIPSEHHGRPIVMATLVHAGDVGAAEEALAPLRSLVRPLFDGVRRMPYPELFEAAPPRAFASLRTMFLDRVDESVAARILVQLRASSAPMALAQLRVLGGAMARVPVEATAFAHRRSRIMLNLTATFASREEAPVHDAWVAASAAALRQADAGAYVNFLGDEGADRVRAAYPRPTWERLAAIKHRYDPTNLFHPNQNIEPRPVSAV